jgi:hypothetical protein
MHGEYETYIILTRPVPKQNRRKTNGISQVDEGAGALAAGMSSQHENMAVSAVARGIAAAPRGRGTLTAQARAWQRRADPATVPSMGKRRTASTAFGIVDLALAVLYLFLVLWVIPSRSSTFTMVALAASTVLAVGGVGMLVQSRLGLVVAAVAASSMVAATFALILLLVASAAYLHGIYDGIGQAGAALAILAALLAIEVVGLVPALQLVHLWRRRREWR